MAFPEAVHHEYRTVESFEIDMLGRLKPHLLFAYLLNSAWNHAESTDFGFHALSSRGLMWVLSKIQLSFHTMPSWRDQISIETWGKRLDRFYALRDFKVASSSNEKLCTATSAWMILDKSSYRPQRLDQMMKDFPWEPSQGEMEMSTRKVTDATHALPAREFVVSYSDIDVNRHVTATRYLQWILDSYPFDFVGKNDLQSVEISFLAEAVLDDGICVLLESNGETDICCIRRKNEEKDLCRAVVIWKMASR
jgi:medium-chain acyl-[acyl-carrier-protein] hydrolase